MNAKLDNLQLMHNILQINYQTTLQHLQKYKQAQVEIVGEQNSLMGDRETEDGSDTGSQSQSIASTDTRQSLKKAEIQWTEKGELQQLRNPWCLLEINCGGWQYFL
ncbi:hypothetical protein C8J57DRAFT_1249475 [Mycena rebaudengoi]|nr:hypothetical protein C8J57DRAFT_1249475 [Mycena rebaudengoi]